MMHIRSLHFLTFSCQKMWVNDVHDAHTNASQWDDVHDAILRPKRHEVTSSFLLLSCCHSDFLKVQKSDDWVMHTTSLHFLTFSCQKMEWTLCARISLHEVNDEHDAILFSLTDQDGARVGTSLRVWEFKSKMSRPNDAHCLTPLLDFFLSKMWVNEVHDADNVLTHRSGWSYGVVK